MCHQPVRLSQGEENIETTGQEMVRNYDNRSTYGGKS